MAAFVLGNGISRADIDINQLSEQGAVYGCNALYRTHSPTALIATDRNIAEEIQKSGYALAHRFYTRRPMPDLGACVVPAAYFGYSSGPIAVAVACIDDHNPIYLLGFDMGPASDGRFNNLYADTQFYKALGSMPTFTGNWIKQMVKVIKDHSNRQFFRVHGPTTAVIAEFESLGNLSAITLDQFSRVLNKPKES